MTLQELLEEVERAPRGQRIGAFFDFDGTLIDGYSARVFYEDQVRRFEISRGQLVRSALAGIDMALRGSDVAQLMKVAVGSWAGRREQEVRDLWQRLFSQRIAGMVFPEARELVEAHRRAGHTIVVASSATRYQVEPLADDLEIEHVLCSEVEVIKGYMSGFVAGEVLWGDAKARAVEEFAQAERIDLGRSFAYANGDEDVPFLETAGNSRPVNPQRRLAQVAHERDWPASQFQGRGRPRIADVVRTGAALAGLGAAGGVGATVGLLTGDRRRGANVAAAIGPDLALALAGVRLNVTGEEHLWSQRPAVFIFNHQSSLDVAIIGALVRRDLTGVAKQEAARDPRFAPIGYVADVVYVDRSNSRQARAALEPAVARLKDGTSIAIAPEGTRSPTPRPGYFKKGAFHLAMQAGVPLVPIVIRNAGELMWRRSLVIRPGTVDVRVLEPISTAGWTVKGLGERIEEVRLLFVQTLEDWPQ
jgi:putative phosphoserine phosphatase/1-acylglycerol-3-phosphate O-acyltransferase